MSYSPLTDDRVFRYVFGEPEGLPLLESLVNAYFEAVGLPLVHQLQLLPREIGPEVVDEKASILDVSARDESGRLVTIEVQTTRKPAFFERSLFYWARLYGRQLLVGENYRELRPVLSLNFLEYDFATGIDWLHYYRLPHTDHLGFLSVELAKLLRTPDQDLNKAAVWGKFLERPEPDRYGFKVAELGPTHQRMEDFMALTPQIMAEVRREMMEHDIATWKYDARMEGLAEGRAEGRVEGLQEGRQEGRLEGRLEERLEMSRRMLDRGFSPSEVADLTELPLETVLSLLH